MRVLLLNWRDLDHPSAGGAERYVHELGRRWAAGGHEVTLFCARPQGMAASGERDGVRIVREGSRWGVYRAARSHLAATRWDAVIESVNTRPFFAHRFVAGTRTLALFYQLARDVWFYEAPLPLALAGRFLFEPRWLRAYRGVPVAAISDSTRRDLEAVGVRPVVVAHPGTQVPPLGLSAKEPVPTLAFLGRLNRSKRPDAAVAAWRLVRHHMPGTRLWVVGEGPMRDRLPIEEGLTVFGRVEERRKWELLARAHLLLVPSVREGWGMVVMEAGAVGTPAVGYRVPGLVDTIRDGESGWVCDPHPEAMAQAALEALRGDRTAAMGARARHWALRFTWDDAAEAVLSAVVDGMRRKDSVVLPETVRRG
ncbi:MAG: glycosyltransferase family 4 protein [Actinomycetota bacterium]|nr:glycosyltransferase family 4 protein [Actinomycetota bacterium]